MKQNIQNQLQFHILAMSKLKKGNEQSKKEMNNSFMMALKEKFLGVT